MKWALHCMSMQEAMIFFDAGSNLTGGITAGQVSGHDTVN
jgi:hypothetical protein